MSISVCLSGRSYFLCANGVNQGVLSKGVDFISLGEGGTYFMRSADGDSAWQLPNDAAAYVNSRPADDQVRYLWLGKNGAYVAQTGRNGREWNLRGLYGSLKNAIEYNTGKISALGMNLEYDRNYFILFNDGQTQGNPSGAALTKAEFDDWVRRWRR
ncbi:hypothetical protein N0V94_009137 [Neodidymelliopsis sp. IMI 364377]|nr:hypothetical protein N0V94_009137 [Neodidymelliopsis sp. IMI 364377]